MNTIEDAILGDYYKFIINANPYKNIQLKEFKKISLFEEEIKISPLFEDIIFDKKQHKYKYKKAKQNKKIDEYIEIMYKLDENLNKKEYFDKYYDLSKLPKYFDYYKNKLITIINKKGIFLYDLSLHMPNPPNICNITYITFSIFSKNISIELNNFYKMLNILNIKDIIFKHMLENKIKNFKSSNLYKAQIIDISKHNDNIFIKKYEIFLIKFIEYILENEHFNECMKIEQFNIIKERIIKHI